MFLRKESFKLLREISVRLGCTIFEEVCIKRIVIFSLLSLLYLNIKVILYNISFLILQYTGSVAAANFDQHLTVDHIREQFIHMTVSEICFMLC